MSKKDFKIRQMTRKEVDLAIEWAALEGWNPGKRDAECFYRIDPNGFFIGEKKGHPIAVLSAVTYGDQLGFLGLYIVHPKFRFQGYGIQLWNHARAYLGYRNQGLDGVVEWQKKYVQSGFRLAYKNIRFGGKISQKNGLASNIVELSSLPFSTLEAYDQKLFPFPRGPFLLDWIHQPQGAALGWYTNGQWEGYGVIRPCQTGYKIGPLFADDPEIAEALLQALLNQVPLGADFYLDLPEPNTKALQLAKRYDMTPIFETARMYTQDPPPIPLHCLYSCTSFEAG